MLNRHSQEAISGTPDFILAHFMYDCLKAFETATNQRDDWKGVRERNEQSVDGA